VTDATLADHLAAYRAGENDGQSGQVPKRAHYVDPAQYRLYGKGYVAGRTVRILEGKGVKVG
jgi:hypothetical protein